MYGDRNKQNQMKMSHSQRTMTLQPSRYIDEFQAKRQTTGTLLMKYLCHFRQKEEISAEEYKLYVDEQVEQIRETNVNCKYIFIFELCTVNFSLYQLINPAKINRST